VERYEDTPGGDVLVHLAEQSSRGQAARLGEAYEQEAMRTLHALLEKPYQRVLYASSAVLYGDRGSTPRTPADPVQADDTYSRIKLRSEKEVVSRGGMAVRLANVYGPGMSSANVLSTVLGQLPLDGPIQVMDTGPVRDFVWVGDAATALALMCSSDHSDASGVFNVGSGRGVSVLELIRIALAAAGQDERNIISKAPQGNAASRLVLDIIHTTKVFGWRPATTLEDGISRLVRTTNSQEMT